MTGCIVGWSHTPFGRHDGVDVEALIGRVVGAALADAGVDAADIDEVFVGQLNAGFARQVFPSSLVMQSVPALRFKRSTRVENACATGSAAIHAGLASIVDVADAQSLLAAAEYQNARARVDVWQALLNQAIAQGNVAAFIELLRAQGVQ